jgi:hypothetical protein
MKKMLKPAGGLAAVLIAVLLAGALAGPAFGGSRTVTGSATTAKKALRSAKSAKRVAKRALTLAQQLKAGANGANGNSGPQGPQGPQGPEGPRGPEGPSQSGNGSLLISSTQDEPVLPVDDPYPGHKVLSQALNGSGLITVDERSRVTANATVMLHEQNAPSVPNTPQVVRCHMNIAEGGTSKTLSRMETSTSFGGKAGDTQQMTLVGGAVIEPGTYELAVFCRHDGGDATVSIAQGDIDSVTTASQTAI